MKPPIYKPSGAALEYGDLALNIYTGCNHGCFYCFAPNVLHKTREDFAKVEPRKNIVEEVRKQMEKEQITGKMIHLCFTCDPYPTGVDTTATFEIIKLLKNSGNHVQILTKAGSKTGACRDLQMLDRNDRFGVSYCGYPDPNHLTELCEPFAARPTDRLVAIEVARFMGIKTWISFEPVLNADDVLFELERISRETDVKIGKLNYHPSSINWHDFGHAAEEICKRRGLTYYIKDSLRAEMEKTNE